MKNPPLTCSETSLVNPRMHIGSLILEMLQLQLLVINLGLKKLNLVLVGSDGIVECPCQWIRGGCHLRRRLRGIVGRSSRQSRW